MNDNSHEIVQLHLWTKRQIDELTEKVSTLQQWKKEMSNNDKNTAEEGEEL